jgi:hypothetical protein
VNGDDRSRTPQRISSLTPPEAPTPRTDRLSFAAETQGSPATCLERRSESDGFCSLQRWGFSFSDSPMRHKQPCPQGGTFVDDNGTSHENNIEANFSAGITRGCNPSANDRFCGGMVVDRGQMAAFLIRALDLPQTDEDFFEDDDTSILEDGINRLAAAGITRGCGSPDGREFCPAADVTRGQIAVVLVRSFGYVDGLVADLFIDDDGSVLEDDIDRLGAVGITRGCNPPENTEFCPSDGASRGQMASLLARTLDLSPITPPPVCRPWTTASASSSATLFHTLVLSMPTGHAASARTASTARAGSEP